MSSSSSKAGLRDRLTPRLAAALAGSAALHAVLIASLQAPFGARWGAISWSAPGAQPLRAVLRPSTPETPARAGTGSPDRGLSSGRSPPLRAGEKAAAAPPATLPTRYYTTSELDVRPGIKTRVTPAYPEAAARRFLSGKVAIKLYLDETGRVESVQVLRAEPPGYFERSAEEAFLRASFTPGMKGGAPVPVQMVIEVTFDSPPPPGLN